MSKYRNKKVDFDGYRFDSLKEMRRFKELKLLENAGEITALVVHPIYRLDINDEHICKYIADFNYKTKSGQIIVEDVKSPITRKLPVYRLKKKLVKAILGIDIVEI